MDRETIIKKIFSEYIENEPNYKPIVKSLGMNHIISETEFETEFDIQYHTIYRLVFTIGRQVRVNNDAPAGVIDNAKKTMASDIYYSLYHEFASDLIEIYRDMQQDKHNESKEKIYKLINNIQSIKK
jgi:hypothetical protein